MRFKRVRQLLLWLSWQAWRRAGLRKQADLTADLLLDLERLP
jgi:hypothetical protein